MASKKNVIIGAASVFLGASWDGVTGSDPAPAASGTTSYRTTVAGTAGWVDVGYTQDGLEVSTDPSFGEVAVDQVLDTVKLFKDGMSFSVTTTFAEATLENLLYAWGMAASNLVSTATDKTFNIDGGSLGQAPLERGLIAVGNGPEKTGTNAYQERAYKLHRVLSVEGAAHTLARADATVFPVTFRALPADTGSYGFIRDRNNVT